MADDFDYDLIIVGCGVGGHGAALHARSCGKSKQKVSTHGWAAVQSRAVVGSPAVLFDAAAATGVSRDARTVGCLPMLLRLCFCFLFFYVRLLLLLSPPLPLGG